MLINSNKKKITIKFLNSVSAKKKSLRRSKMIAKIHKTVHFKYLDLATQLQHQTSKLHPNF